MGSPDDPSDAGAASADAAQPSGDGGSTEAGHADAAGVDAGVSGTVCRNGQVLCPANGLCQTSCAGCTDYPIECFACDSNQQNPIGTCQPNNVNAFCLNGDYSTAYNGGQGAHCDCSNTVVSNCPGANQVCVNAGQTDWCLTCGEPNSDGRTCKNGGQCKGDSRVCD